LRLLSTHPPPTELSSLSLHDALPIFHQRILDARMLDQLDRLADERLDQQRLGFGPGDAAGFQIKQQILVERTGGRRETVVLSERDRKSTRLNSSHQIISYAVFCLKKK